MNLMHRDGIHWIEPDLALPAGIRFWTAGGRGLESDSNRDSNQSYDWSDKGTVALDKLARTLNTPSIVRMRQVHGNQVARVNEGLLSDEQVDACVTHDTLSLGVLSADCLPLVACDSSGVQIGAAHAGWRGLAAGVFPNFIKAFDTKPEDLIVWIGPAISMQAFQVGWEVIEAFKSSPAFEFLDLSPHIQPDGTDDTKAYLDLPGLALAQLKALGVEKASWCGVCTFKNSSQFSFRRDQTANRLLTGVTKTLLPSL